jgi:hypothetical protein
MIARLLFDDLTGEQFDGGYINVSVWYRRTDNSLHDPAPVTFDFVSMENAWDYITNKLERATEGADGNLWRLARIEIKDAHSPVLPFPFRAPNHSGVNVESDSDQSGIGVELNQH